MKYRIELTDPELNDLAWLTDKGYWPADAYDGLTLADDQPESVGRNENRTWELSEPAAWSITVAGDDDGGCFLSCCGDPLLSKLLALWESIG